MIEEKRKDWPLVRFIVPTVILNIFSATTKITPLGLLMVATSANKLWGWRVEIVDENIYSGQRDKKGFLDHEFLQKENPASVVGFYCGLTSTMDRIFELARLYHNYGAMCIAGGWHTNYCPEEALDNGIDVVVHGDGEIIIQQILTALIQKTPLNDIQGISFWQGKEKVINESGPQTVPSLNELPYPDFGLIRTRKKIKTYPICRTRGCGMNCEFCSVKGAARWASPQHFFNTVKWLVETRKAKSFFIVDDRLEEDTAGTIEFFNLIAAAYGDRLSFTVQIRLESAKNYSFLSAMKKAGVRNVCIGYESPIDEDLKAMRKGYLSQQMIEWTKLLREFFWVHGMFIFGYPAKDGQSLLSVKDRIKRFKRFIRIAKLDSIQVLHPVPLAGTDLRKRLEKEGRVFPEELVPWNKYDGNYACFEPTDMTIEELQESPTKIMEWFYSPLSFLKIPLKTIAMPFEWVARGFRGFRCWHRSWQKSIINAAGHLLLRRWIKRQENDSFLKQLESYQHKT